MRVRAVLLVLAFVCAGCPDLGDKPMNWSQFDRPEPPPELDAEVPVDGGDAGADPSDASDPPPEHADVRLFNITIDPMEVRISEGGTVSWQNLDLVQHDVRSGTPEAPTALFNSGLMDRGTTFTFQFDTAGRYDYFCSTHANVMRGALVEVVE